jgi:hypothetical protein
MSMPSWPVELKKPLSDGFQQAREDNRRIMRAERGPPRIRRGSSKAAEAVSVAFYCSHDQRARFDRFHIEETEEGALPFLVPAWGVDNHDLLTADGLNLLTHDDVPLLIASTWVCLFGQTMPSVVAMGLEWRVSFDLVILP